MILIDYNQMVLSSLFAAIGNHTNSDLDENSLRHLIINSLRVNAKKFKREYGQIVVCADGRKSWRRDVFPYYKAARRKSRKESELDWDFIHGVMGKVREEIAEYLPYKVLHFENLEADDIIGVLVYEYGGKSDEKILIVSSDKDFIQLHVFPNVAQYDATRNRWIKHSSPKDFLHEHILIGDRSDGIPNVMSKDSTLVEGIRQKPITKKRKEQWCSPDKIDDAEILKNYQRNKLLIDLTETPEHLKDMVLAEMKKEKTIGKRRMTDYFIKYDLQNMMPDKGDF